MSAFEDRIRTVGPTANGLEADLWSGSRKTPAAQGGRPELSIALAVRRGLGPPEDWEPESIKSRALAGVIALIQAHDMQVRVK